MQMASSKKYDRLYKAVGYLTKKNQMSAITLGLQQACDHEEERRSLLEDEAAKKREEEGILNAVLAVGTIVIGAVAIVATWGAATPLVVTACVAGGSAIAYGASNLVEAGQDIYYGSIGDPYTVAFNPIRDTVFCGNQEVYDLWGGVATDVAGMLIPIGIASKAATSSVGVASKLANPKVIQTVASGVHGAVSAGVGNVKQQFYEKGSLEAIDWGEVAGKSTVSGVVGAGTGAAGAGISSKATSWLSNRAITSSLLNSESAVTRVAANFAVGSVSEVASGTVSRFAGGVISTGDVEESLQQAFDPKNMLFDAALGGTVSGFKGIPKPINTGELKIIEQRNAYISNNEWKKRGYDEPPYDPSYQTRIVEAGSEEYVRVYSINKNGKSNKLGRWFMRKADIEGLSASEIANKYALPEKPTHICDVDIPDDTKLQVGIANRVENWGTGGGLQFDSMDKKLPPSSFGEGRLIGDN